MNGVAPSQWLRGLKIRSSPLKFSAACNGDGMRLEDGVFACDGADNHGDDREVTCRDCLLKIRASLDPQSLVRLDHLETLKGAS
jgi:hypothetical protein